MTGSTAEIALLTVSLVLNILILVPLCITILRDPEHISVVYGKRTPARDILLCVYLAILVASVALLVLVHMEATWAGAKWASVALLTIQVVYKLLTTVMVHGGKPPQRKFNPVVATNFGVAIVHIVAVAVAFSSPVGALPLSS